MEHENYLVLLELPFDEKELDAEVVRAALHSKKQEWTRLQNNPGKRGMALKYLDLAPEIEKALLNPVTRARQAEAARELRADMVRRMEAELRVLEAKGYLTPKEVTAVSVKYRPWAIDKKAVEDAARCPISDLPPVKERRDTAVKEETQEILDRITARAIDRGLNVLGFGSLYDYLGLAQYSSIQKLGDAAEAKRKEAQQSAAKSASVTASQELAGICQKVFADFNSKQKYDRYLKVSKYPALGELIDEEHARSGYVSQAVVLRLVNFAVETYTVGVLEAEEYIRNYCATYDIPLGEKHRTVSCPHCGEEVDRQAPLCTACGAPLRGDCPGCGSHFSEGIALCPDCGFALGDMGKALRHIDDAQNALIENNWGTAQRNVQYAKKYWPGHPQIEALEKRSITLEERYGWYVDNVKDCVQHNQYYAALELIQEAEARRIRLPGTTVEHVAKVIADFETRLAALTSGTPTIEKVLALGELVGDSIELSRMMKQHPPQEPSGLTAVLADKRVLLSWGQSPSPGLIEYILVRKRGAKPLTPFDGDALYKGRGTSFEDETIESLNEYYYCVFAGRGGAYSLMGPSAGPILLIPEIEDLLILPIDHGAQFRWKHNPYIKHVTLWRKLGGEKPTAPGEGYKLETTRIDGFTDTKIKNDVEYWYYVVATYAVDGREVHSKGVLGNVTPHKFVAPVESLVVVKTDDGEDSYVANWQSTEHSDVLLLAAGRRPEHHSGDIIPVDRLLSQYRRLDADPRGESSARFTLPLNGGIWLFAAAVFGKFASVSQYFYLTNVKNVEHPTYDLVGDELFINMKWPTGLQEIAVAYRLDKFPQEPDEMGATMMHITREQYDYDAAVVLREPEQTTYYAKIFSKFVTPDGNTIYSDGVELLIDNTPQQELFYDVKLKKKLLAKVGTMSITISSDEPFRLPRAVFMSKVGRIPLSKVDGVSLFEIEKELTVEGEVTFEMETEGLPDELYIRMFLHDDAGYAKYHLLPSSSMRIS